MRRPQFTLRALFVTMLAAGCFCGGVAWQRNCDGPLSIKVVEIQDDPDGKTVTKVLTLRDGTEWFRTIYQPLDPLDNSLAAKP